MRIGIATLFAPSNYGNALQMLSMLRYLEEHGYKAEIISHWLSRGCPEINYYHNRLHGKRSVLQFVVDALSCGGAWSNYRRERKMQKWVAEHYTMSALSGADGEFPVDKLDYDCVIAGSDQIWNPKSNWPEFNLLKDIPEGIRRVAYAASFGTDDSSLFEKERYVPALKKFESISTRERSARRIIVNQFGLPADLVCDPTLLHTEEEWRKMLGIKKGKVKNQYAVYLVTPEFRMQKRVLLRLARELRAPVHFFAFSSYAAPGADYHKPFNLIVKAVRNVAKALYLRIHGIRLHMTATPTEFVTILSQSKGLFTDSFHGMMFATIFNKQCNVAIGTHPERLLMSARLRDFTSEFGNSEMLTPEFTSKGLRKAEITPALQELIDKSKGWLQCALKGGME